MPLSQLDSQTRKLFSLDLRSGRRGNGTVRARSRGVEAQTWSRRHEVPSSDRRMSARWSRCARAHGGVSDQVAVGRPPAVD